MTTPTAALDALNEISGRIYSLLNQLVDDKSAPVWSNVKSDIETIRTALANAPQWLPIKSAPMDGTRILIWNRVTGTCNVYFWAFGDDDGHCWFRDSTSGRYAYTSMPELTKGDWLTHWMPLPAAPKGRE